MFLPQLWQKSQFQSKISPQVQIIFDLITLEGFRGLLHLSQNLVPLLFLWPQIQIKLEFSLFRLLPHSVQYMELISLMVEHVHNIEISDDMP